MKALMPVRWAMVGGGEGAFIGAIHRHAAALDGKWNLVAGAFSSDSARNERSGRALGISPDRIYESLEALLDREAERAPEDRVEAISIVTPNHLHVSMSIAALEAGFHVLCEKPMALDLESAKRVFEAAQNADRQYALAFTYSGYPLIHEARMRIGRGDLGKLRLVNVEYSQGWLSSPIDAEGNKQAEWRTDPNRAGLGGCLGDIGTHAFQLLELVTGSRVAEVCADLATHVEGRQLDDDVNVLLRMECGARGILKATQVAAGDENTLRIRVHGERGGMEWSHADPNTLIIKWLDRPAETLRAAAPYLHSEIAGLYRAPAGHPEGFIEAFGNLYRAFACTIRETQPEPFAAPSFPEGLRTMAFVEAVIRNARSAKKWTPLTTDT